MLVRRLGITITQPKLEVCLTAVNYIWNPLTCIRPQSGRGAQDLRSRGALQTEDSLTESYKWQVLPARAQLLQYVDTESLCDSLTKMQLIFTKSRLAASFRHYQGQTLISGGTIDCWGPLLLLAFVLKTVVQKSSGAKNPILPRKKQLKAMTSPHHLIPTRET